MSDTLVLDDRPVTVRDRLRGVPPIWVVLLLVVVVIAWRDPAFLGPPSLMAFLKRSAPLIVVALGQLFVIVSGEFDLSVGALITAGVVVAARLGAGDPTHTWWVVLVLVGTSLLVGLVNGLVTTVLKVPSFITTLGTQLVLSGAVFLWTGGSPTGALADNLRVFGRSGVAVPVLGQLPWAVPILVAVVVAAAATLQHTRYGHQVYAAGGGTRAATLSGVDVRAVRTGAFMISALSAALAAILLAGFAGLSADAGNGYEFQAITTVVLGGAVLGGGRGTTIATVGGALTLQALFTVLNLFGFAQPLRDSAEGLLIIAAGAYTAYRARRTG